MITALKKKELGGGGGSQKRALHTRLFWGGETNSSSFILYTQIQEVQEVVV